MVNRAIEDLVTTSYGEDAWKRISERAGVADRKFAPLEPYPDELTGTLMEAASRVLSIPVDALVYALGRHWIRYIDRDGYGGLIALFGSSFREVLSNLDHLHTRMGLMMPGLVLPQVTVRSRNEDESSRNFVIEYRSPRAGFTPMFVGLIEALAERFGARIRVETRNDDPTPIEGGAGREGERSLFLITEEIHP